MQFSEKLREALYIGYTDYRCCKIFQNGASFVTNQNLATFLGQNFQVFLWSDLEENNLWNYLLWLVNIMPARNFSNSSYLSRSKIWVSAWFYYFIFWMNFECYDAAACNFCEGWLKWLLLDLNRIILPVFMLYYMRYCISATHMTLLNLNEYHVSVTARLWIRHGLA